MSTDLIWTTQKRKISDLKEHPKNPRQISGEQIEHLKNSIKTFNYVETVAINTDGTILAGHMRIQAMKDLGRKKEEIEVRVPNRPLTEKEADEYLIRSNKNTGEWDFDVLANNWDKEELISWGWTEKELGLDEDLIEKEIEEVNLDEKIILEIECENMDRQKELYDEMTSRGFKCKLLTL